MVKIVTYHSLLGFHYRGVYSVMQDDEGFFRQFQIKNTDRSDRIKTGYAFLKHIPRWSKLYALDRQNEQGRREKTTRLPFQWRVR